jgi:hypothetical protein
MSDPSKNRPPITSPDDPRLAEMGYEEIAGEHQIPEMLSLAPRARLQLLVDMLDFEDRAHRARIVPRKA